MESLDKLAVCFLNLRSQQPHPHHHGPGSPTRRNEPGSKTAPVVVSSVTASRDGPEDSESSMTPLTYCVGSFCMTLLLPAIARPWQVGCVAYPTSFDSTSSSLSSSSSSLLPCPLHAPAGSLVDLIFTPPLPSWPSLSSLLWSRRPLSSSRLRHFYKWLVVVCRFAWLVVVVVVVKQKQRRKRDWFIVV